MVGLLAGLVGSAVKAAAAAAHQTTTALDDAASIGGADGSILKALTASARGMTEAAARGAEKFAGFSPSFDWNLPEMASLGRGILGGSAQQPVTMANASPANTIAAPVKQRSIYECDMNDVVCPVTPVAATGVAGIQVG